MPKTKLVLLSLLNSLGVLIYVLIVAEILNNGQMIFGNKMPGVLGPVAFLLLFVFSAAVVGALVLGRPLILYLDGAKSDALKIFFYMLGWMFLFLATIFLLLAVAYWS